LFPMNVLCLSVLSTFCALTLLTPVPAVLMVAPNWSYPANDHMLIAAVSSDRPFIAKVLSDRSLIEDTPPLEPRRSGSRRSTMNPGTMTVSHQKESG